MASLSKNKNKPKTQTTYVQAKSDKNTQRDFKKFPKGEESCFDRQETQEP